MVVVDVVVVVVVIVIVVPVVLDDNVDPVVETVVPAAVVVAAWRLRLFPTGAGVVGGATTPSPESFIPKTTDPANPWFVSRALFAEKILSH